MLEKDILLELHESLNLKMIPLFIISPWSEWLRLVEWDFRGNFVGDFTRDFLVDVRDGYPIRITSEFKFEDYTNIHHVAMQRMIEVSGVRF